MSFFEELKRRNVFRVGIAYVVGTWILVQVADILFENIGTPDWVMQTMLVFLGIGFFVALFFAWALASVQMFAAIHVDRAHLIPVLAAKDDRIVGLVELNLYRITRT